MGETKLTHYQNVIGRRLAGIDLSEDKERLTLRFQEGESQAYRAEGDCCSQSWIEHLTVPPDIDGATILRVTESEAEATAEERSKTEAERQYVDSLRVYHTSFVTDRGEVIVEYRNDSNGYYGGWLEPVSGGSTV